MHQTLDLGTQFYTPAWNVIMKLDKKKETKKQEKRKMVYSCVWKFKVKKKEKIIWKEFSLLFFILAEIFFSAFCWGACKYSSTCIILFPVVSLFTEWPKCERNSIPGELHMVHLEVITYSRPTVLCVTLCPLFRHCMSRKTFTLHFSDIRDTSLPRTDWIP